MKASIHVSKLCKSFVLAEKGAGPASLWQALSAGKQAAVSYREVRALKDVSFDVRQGERVGVIGRNGAGKTTLLSILAGVAESTSGTVEIVGDVHAMLTIGAVLREEITGRENIWLDGTMHGKSQEEIASHVEAIVAFADLGEFIDRPVRTYSSGMKGRLAFSMGAFIEPDILIIDETLAVGDAFFADKSMRRMKEIARQGRIVFMVSHSLGSIVDMCDRCIWLDQGKIVMDGEPKSVTDAYQAAVTQADEAELARKFAEGEIVISRPEIGRITRVDLIQDSKVIAATATAFYPFEIRVAGVLMLTTPGLVRPVDLQVALTRVDGRPIWRQRLSATGQRLPESGAFTVGVTFDPMLLGADLYGLDVLLCDDAGPIDTSRRAFEVIDEQGQHGGRPLLYYPPVITTRALEAS
ncbi:ABC transporter ATP-binding protein [Bradyrhizobium sp. JYMT SZCCT0428]|uniref:ABC transporter ATP-binding protein n=1 Tax=Bradyrhizobium sp. JYMT SZCCT0428 TaxID=2807673 RepID=UPI001BAD35EE|nr:ABC transporter ATP-binding protein [Bradyrhizobium sp. JYMT SZCCT0428]MBR1156123.1 ABC transporter ATP-binding protein [Bradyrhizobium sp. JYMT SZCCT0428]